MRRVAVLLVLLLACLLSAPFSIQAEQAESNTVPLAEPFQYTRLFADDAGASRFADEEMEFALVDFAPPAPAISLSKASAAQSVALMSSPPGWHGDWHPAPQRQLIIILSGELEVEVSDGQVRIFGPGSVVLVEDTFGEGHVSRVVRRERVYCVVVPLGEE